MFKRSLPLLLVLALVILAFVGCSKTPYELASGQGKTEKLALRQDEKTEQVLVWNLGADVKTIDPQLNSAANGGYIINNTFEGLMRESEGGNVEPAMAESYKISEDGLTYTFKLRDAKWSDGKPVTAHDFVYSWKRALNLKLDPEPSEYAFQLFYVKGGQEYFKGTGSIDDVAVVAKDDKTLEVTLVAPTPYFLYLTSFYTFMPVRKDIVEQDPLGWAIRPDLVVCNGPFKVAEYKSGDKFVLVKNENYWNEGNVKLDRIEVTLIVNESTVLAAYQSDKLDVIDRMPIREIPKLQAEDATFQILPQLGVYYYIFQVNKKPVNDVRVRRALTLAIDRNAIVTTITKASQVPATGYVPYGLKDADGNEFRKVAGDYGIDPHAAKVEEAKKLLAEAGYPDGKGFPEIEIIYNTMESHRAIAEAIQEMWKQNLGIGSKLINQEWAIFQETRRQGNFTVARGGWAADYYDPMTFLDLWTSYSGNNDAQWDNKEFDRLIEKSKLKEGKGRYDLLYEAEKLVMDDSIVMPIYYYTAPIMVKEKVKDWEKSGLGHWFFGKTYIED